MLPPLRRQRRMTQDDGSLLLAALIRESIGRSAQRRHVGCSASPVLLLVRHDVLDGLLICAK